MFFFLLPSRHSPPLASSTKCPDLLGAVGESALEFALGVLVCLAFGLGDGPVEAGLVRLEPDLHRVHGRGRRGLGLGRGERGEHVVADGGGGQRRGVGSRIEPLGLFD